MKQRLLVSLLTIVVFAAGFFARFLTEREHPLPPPPASLLGEFASGKGPAATEKKPAPKPFDRAQLVADIEKLRPQIDAYRARLETIDREYEAAFALILNLEQRAIYQAKQEKHRAESESKAALAPPSTPLSEEEIAKLRQRPFESAFWKVSYSGRLETAVREYKLDAKQEAAVRQLLIERREKFLALVDATPPPTFKLTALAASVQRLLDPAAEPAATTTPAPAK